MDEKAIAVIIEPLDATKRAAVKKAFTKMETSLDAMTSEYDELMEKEVSKEVCADARVLRLRIATVRKDGEKWKDKEKKQYLSAGNAIQGLFNYLKGDTTKKEAALKDVEDHYQREAEKIIEDRKEARLILLAPYNVDSSFVDLGNMPDDIWAQHFSSIQDAAEKSAADAQKESAEQKAKDLQQEVFESRTKLLLPYGQFQPLLDLYPETTADEFEALLKSMEDQMQIFTDNQASLFKENVELKKENVKLVAEVETDVNKFKKDTLFGFSGGAEVEKDLGTDKEASLGEMLGFDEPEEENEEESVNFEGLEITLPAMGNHKFGEAITPLSGKDDKGILKDLADMIQGQLGKVAKQEAKTAIVAAANTLRGAAMMIR